MCGLVGTQESHGEAVMVDEVQYGVGLSLRETLLVQLDCQQLREVPRVDVFEPGHFRGVQREQHVRGGYEADDL